MHSGMKGPMIRIPNMVRFKVRDVLSLKSIENRNRTHWSRLPFDSFFGNAEGTTEWLTFRLDASP